MRRVICIIVTGLSSLRCAGCDPPSASDSVENETSEASISPTVSAVATSDETASSVSVTTNFLPRGWFTAREKPSFTKTPVTATFSAQSACVNFSQTRTSAEGLLTPLQNPTGKPIAYAWSASSGEIPRNRWKLRIHCNGTISTIGCSDALDVAAHVTVAGACHEDAGHACEASASASLGALQDPDDFDPCGGEDPTKTERARCLAVCLWACGPNNYSCYKTCAMSCR